MHIQHDFGIHIRTFTVPKHAESLMSLRFVNPDLSPILHTKRDSTSNQFAYFLYSVPHLRVANKNDNNTTPPKMPY